MIQEQQHIDVSGVRLHLRRAGSGDPMLFLHGFPESSLSWVRQLEAFAPRHHVAAPDGRGFGRSDVPSGVDAYAVDRLVGDVLAVADALGAERFTLVGHDWGGLVGWITAARHAARVERLVIVNAPHPTLFQDALDHDPEQRGVSAYIARLTTGPVPTPEQLWAATFGADEARGLIDAAERAALLAAWRRPGAVEAMLNWYRAAPFDFAPVGGRGAGRLPGPLRIEVPTLVIWGEDDPILLPGLLDGLETLVPDLTVARVAGASHAILREQPERVSRLIADYLEQRSR
jgi:pimeloyl-ACP methyl ester carboxylesterase